MLIGVGEKCKKKYVYFLKVFIAHIADTKRSLINRTRQYQATCLGHVMRRETRTSNDNWNDLRKTQQVKKMWDGITRGSKKKKWQKH